MNFCVKCLNSTICTKCDATHFLASNSTACLTNCSTDLGFLILFYV